MGKVLVVKAIEPNYNTLSGGPPVMMVGGGGRRRGGDRAVGRTKRERLGGVLGGTVGVLGALGGQHRSLGGLVQSMISGGAQGKALGGALGRSGLAGVTRRRQARADIDEGTRQRYADLGARGELDRFQFNRPIHQLSPRGNLDRMESQIGAIDAEKARQAQQAREEQARAKAQAAAEGTQFGEENRRYAQSYRDLRDAYQGRFDPETQNNLVQVLGQDNATMRTEVVPEEDIEIVSEDTHPNETPVRDAAGHSVGVVGGMGPQLLSLPAPAGGANTEISDIESAGNTEAMNTGTDHQRRETVKVVNPKKDEEEESLESIQRREAGMQPSGNQQSTVGVVDNMRPTEQPSLYDFEQGGN